MSIYHPVTSGECSLCHTHENLVAHQGGGELHPTCRKCINMAGFIGRNCPVSGCDTRVDSGSLFTLKERVVKELAYLACDAAIGVSCAVYGAVQRSEDSVENVKSNMFYDSLLAVGFGIFRRHIAGNRLAGLVSVISEETKANPKEKEVVEAPPKTKEVIEAPATDFVGFKELFTIFDNYLNVLKDPEGAKEYGVQLPAGIMLHGAPGCGKTYAANQLKNYAQQQGISLNFKSVQKDEITSKWIGEGVKNIKRVFEEAKRRAPCILFLDEFEGLVPSRESLNGTGGSDKTSQVGVLLTEIEEAKKHNVIVVAATNHLNKIDPAIIRTGRFDYTFEVKPPSSEMRTQMLQKKLEFRTSKVAEGIDFAKVAGELEGCNASTIDTLVNHVCAEAWKVHGLVTEQLLIESIGVVMKGYTPTVESVD